MALSQGARPLKTARKEHPARAHLRTAIVAKSPRGMMSALWRVREFYPDRPFPKLPIGLRIIQLVTELEMANQYEFGISQILEDDDTPEMGAFVPAASKWFAGIGAERASAYLARATALFPKGRIAKVPVDRMWQIEAILERSESAFENLDREFRGWGADLRPALQRYLKKEERQLLAALAEELEEPSVPTLEELLAVRDPSDCLDGLASAVEQRGQAALTKGAGAETAQMIMLFWDLDLYAGHGDGLWKFLDRGHIRDELDRAERWCEQIGATEAVTYFREYRKAFPDGVIPTGFRKRSAILERNQQRLGRIDAKHDRAIPKMSRRFLTYLRANPDLVSAALGQGASPGPATTRRASGKR